MTSVQKASPILAVDLGGDVPVVQQITDGLRRCLLDGELAPGDLLPSSRALARDLGVHFNTVAQAYRELESEGWLALRRRAGSVVLDRRVPRPGGDERGELSRTFSDAFDVLLTRFQARGLAGEELRRLAGRVLDERLGNRVGDLPGKPPGKPLGKNGDPA